MFLQITERLLRERRVTGLFVQGVARPPSAQEVRAFDAAWGGKSEMKGGNRQMKWGDWLIESCFPTYLYAIHGGSLRATAQDPRLHVVPKGFSSGDSWTCAFGQVARPRPPDLPEGFILFMLERMKGKYKGMPHFYFNTEDPAWVCAPLSGRPDIPKTLRTSVSCVMNVGFHYLDGKINMAVVLRHMNWSHEWGDVYGGNLFLRAVCKELGAQPGVLSIFANSASMDTPKIAKAYLANLARDYRDQFPPMGCEGMSP